MKSKRSAAGGRRSRGATERKRVRGEDRLRVTLERLSGALDSMGIPWMVIGGYAVIAHGVKRMTTDVDVAVRGDSTSVEVLAATLEEHGIVPRIEDAIAFAKRSLVLLLRDRESDVQLDLSFAWSPFEHEALAHAQPQRIGDVELPIARAEDLVVYKVMAGRPHDLTDAETLLLLYPKIARARVRRHTRALAEMAETPEMVDRLEKLFARVKKKR